MKRQFQKLLRGRSFTLNEADTTPRTLADFEGEGLAFSVKFHGRFLISDKDGAAQAEELFVKARNSKKGNMNKKIKATLFLTKQGVSIRDRETQSLLATNPIYSIAAYYYDDHDPEMFAINVKGEGGNTGKAGCYNSMLCRSPQGLTFIGALKQLLKLLTNQRRPLPAPPPASSSSSSPDRFTQSSGRSMTSSPLSNEAPPIPTSARPLSRTTSDSAIRSMSLGDRPRSMKPVVKISVTSEVSRSQTTPLTTTSSSSDWRCTVCGAKNSSTATTCPQCHASHHEASNGYSMLEPFNNPARRASFDVPAPSTSEGEDIGTEDSSDEESPPEITPPRAIEGRSGLFLSVNNDLYAVPSSSAPGSRRTSPSTISPLMSNGNRAQPPLPPRLTSSSSPISQSLPNTPMPLKLNATNPFADMIEENVALEQSSNSTPRRRNRPTGMPRKSHSFSEFISSISTSEA